MSAEPENHRVRWEDDLAAYVLDALGEREAALFEHHLEDCDECRERVAWLTPALDVLPATVSQQDPPPALRSRLMEIVEREVAEAAPPRSKRRRLFAIPLFGGTITLRPALASFGVALLLIAGVVGYSLSEDATSTETYSATATKDSSLASGTLEVDGDEGSLKVANLPAPGRDEVYQAWVQHTGDNGRIVPSSVFAVHDDGTGEVAIPGGLDGAARVMVTREPEGGSKKPTEGALLIAELE